MGQLKTAIAAIDPELYIYTAANTLQKFSDEDGEPLSAEVFNQAVANSPFETHRQALELSQSGFEARDSLDFMLFGGSVACLSLLKLPGNSFLMKSFRQIGEPGVYQVIRETADDQEVRTEAATGEILECLADKYNALFDLIHLTGCFARQHRYEDEAAAALLGGAAIVNFAWLKLAETEK